MRGPLRLLGEDVSAVLDFVAARLKVTETARLKKSCRHCERIVQPPAPTRPIRRGMAGPSLLAHILVSKFDDHVPLYRQREIFARHGADIPRSTLIDWCGQAVATLRALSERIRRAVMKPDRLHADGLGRNHAISRCRATWKIAPSAPRGIAPSSFS